MAASSNLKINCPSCERELFKEYTGRMLLTTPPKLEVVFTCDVCGWKSPKMLEASLDSFNDRWEKQIRG